MPYNTNPIPRKEKPEWDGTSYLPLARVRKIIKLDPDIDACTPAAAFLIAVAAESFIWDFSETAHRMTKIEKKPRKNLQYKDLANAVARFDNLEFMTDVVPRTVTFAKALQQKRDVGAGKTKKKTTGEQGNGEGTSAAKDGDLANTSGQEENSSDAGSPSETTRLKNLHLSNQTGGSGDKKAKTSSSMDQDGDLVMQ
ncbi:hypothetical protein DRE_02843 [Drechslerella stenobrocha 248]|uniref:Transcription factor CBF/NF-Y/archaeal histone domain-containing protein n=1 Tax=Drechslerella stenobrocha 248 TaxID=1043628 RepID=W7HUV8_9PEZI|nr:hypothetical protein DRE_02843 [Drechslerella stenobrocha 248]